jgi:hypothetical protein
VGIVVETTGELLVASKGKEQHPINLRHMKDKSRKCTTARDCGGRTNLSDGAPRTRIQLDNQKVFGILTQLLSGTPAWTWISWYEASKSGKLAYQALRVHFGGPGESMKQNNHAYKILENTHYKSERLFTFESYVTKLLEAFEILEDNGMGKNELEQVKILLDGIQSDNQTVIAAKTTIMMNDTLRTSFQVAVDRLSKFIGVTFSGKTTYNGKQAARNISRMETGHGRGRGGRAG